MLNAWQKLRFEYASGGIVERIWAVLDRMPLALKINHRMPLENHSCIRSPTRDGGA